MLVGLLSSQPESFNFLMLLINWSVEGNAFLSYYVFNYLLRLLIYNILTSCYSLLKYIYYVWFHFRPKSYLWVFSIIYSFVLLNLFLYFDLYLNCTWRYVWNILDVIIFICSYFIFTFICVYVCVAHTFVQGPKGTWSCRCLWAPSCGCWDLNSASL